MSQVTTPAAETITLAELGARLAEAEPAALLVPSRVVRRVIKHDKNIGGVGLSVPHRKTYVVAARELLKLAEREELDIDLARELPAKVLLVARPEPERLAEMPADAALVKYWRLTYHARLHLELERRIEAGRLTDLDVRDRIHALGQVEFDEIRSVLKREDYLFSPFEDRGAYVEFVAVFCELRRFAPSLLPWYFPGIADYDAIDAVLEADVDAQALYESTRPAGAPDPDLKPVVEVEEHEYSSPAEAPVEAPAHPSPRKFARLMKKAARTAAKGNQVRAAILRTRAGAQATGAGAAEAAQAARAELEQLSRRLQAALDLDDAEAARFAPALAPLLAPASRGFWRREYRLLYDLQNACVDHERDISTVDLVEWVLSGFRRPIRRPLPGQREVLMSKHLHAAAARLLGVRLTDEQRQPLSALLKGAVERAAEHLRDWFRPKIASALDRVGLAPNNLPERVSRRKLVEELLDRIVQRGFLTMFDLRDAISRNNVKLPDLPAAREFINGDRLLRADRELSVAIDGAYRRGEAYLRWPQRLSSLAFATPIGRRLVSYVALPYGGAFVGVQGMHYLVDEVVHLATHEHIASMGMGTALAYSAAIGTVLLFLLHSERFRRGVWSAIRGIVRLIRGVVVEFPLWLREVPAVRLILDSQAFRFARRYGFKPAVYAGLWLLLAPSLRTTSANGTKWWLLLFVLHNLLLNSRFGRNVEEVITDVVVRSWERFRIRVVAAAVQVVVEFFHRLLDALDRFLYSVDEWLRFRSGQSNLVMAAKALLGVVWFFAMYVVRAIISLCAEPQLNPVKHFPVVTVSHKVMLPVTLLATEWAGPLLEPLFGGILGPAIAFTAFQLLPPGIFGFLAWELKENWRLYEANRRGQLKPAMIGSHGETMLQFLKPGFHSGTLPKLYARLRRADRKALQTGHWRPSLHYREALHHVEHAIGDFFERELIALLNESRRWGGLEVRVGRIILASNIIRVELLAAPDGSDHDGSAHGANAHGANDGGANDGGARRALRMTLEEQSGWLIASIVEPGWLDDLDAERTAVFCAALAGFYKLAGVDLIREQLQRDFHPAAWCYDVSDEGLVVWPHAAGAGAGAMHGGFSWRRGRMHFGPRAVYDLRKGPMIVPKLSADFPDVKPPVLDRGHSIFGATPAPWDLWIEIWRHDQDDDGRHKPFSDYTRLLPVAYPERK